MASEIAIIHEQIKAAVGYDGQKTVDEIGQDLFAIMQKWPKAEQLCQAAWRKVQTQEEQRHVLIAVAGGYKAEADKSAEQLEELANAVINADRHNSLVDDLIEDVSMEMAEERESLEEEFAYADARDTVRGELVDFCERQLNLNGYHARDFVSILMGTPTANSEGLSDAALIEIGELIESLFEREAR